MMSTGTTKIVIPVFAALVFAPLAVARFTAPALVASTTVRVTAGPWKNAPDLKSRAKPKPKHRSEPGWDEWGNGRGFDCEIRSRGAAACKGHRTDRAWRPTGSARGAGGSAPGASARTLLRSKIHFIGVANAGGFANGASALTLPAESRAGDLALVLTYGQGGGHDPQIPTGYTAITRNAGGRNMVTDLAYKVLAVGETAVPATTTGYGVEVAVYRGVSGVGAHVSAGGSVDHLGGANAPLSCPGIALAKTDGSSWVVCLGGDGYASTNAKSMVFGSNTTNRSAGLRDRHTGLADTHGPVSSWATARWMGDNFPLPGRHGVEMYAIELLSG